MLPANDTVRLVDPANLTEIATLIPQQSGLNSEVRFHPLATPCLTVPPIFSRYEWKSGRGRANEQEADGRCGPVPTVEQSLFRSALQPDGREYRASALGLSVIPKPGPVGTLSNPSASS